MLLNEEVPPPLLVLLLLLLEQAGGEQAIASEKRDSLKGWEQECSSLSQGHCYFMAFAFLHDTSDAQNRRSSIA